jgi:chemotaxis protein CheX
MLPSEDVVIELTRVIWSTMLGLEATQGGESTEAAAFVTSVDIAGAWLGTVSISFTRTLAERVTAAMLESSQADASPADVSDVIRELANMVGGNVKGLFPGPCSLSIPRVEPAAAGFAASTGSRSWFDCGGQPFSVTVSERSGGPS